MGGSGSSTSGVDDKSVADLSRTCANLQVFSRHLDFSSADNLLFLFVFIYISDFDFIINILESS